MFSLLLEQYGKIQSVQRRLLSPNANPRRRIFGVATLAITTFLLALICLWITFFSAPHAAVAQYDPNQAVINPELTSVAKAAARASDFFLISFNDAGQALGNARISLVIQALWRKVFGLTLTVYAVIAIIIGFGYILRLNWLNKWRRYVPWLFVSVIFAALSYVIAMGSIGIVSKFIEGVTRSVTGVGIVNLSGQYARFDSLKSMPSIDSAESVQNTIALLKLLTWTSYTLGAVFFIRNFILWIMIIIIPLIFPLIVFPVTQAVGKLWLKEFVRWLFYGALVALFLTISNIIFAQIQYLIASPPALQSYPQETEISLFLPDATSNKIYVGDDRTYYLYLVSIIMLWISVVLPFFLLHYGIKGVEQVATEWYNQGKLNPRLQSIIGALQAPTGKGTRTVAGSQTPQASATSEGKKASPSPLTSLRSLITGSGKEKIIAPTEARPPTGIATMEHKAPISSLDQGIAPLPSTPPPGSTPLAPRRPLNLQPALISGVSVAPLATTPTPSATQKTTVISNILRQTGLNELSRVTEEVAKSRVQNSRLQQIARLETQPARLAQVVAQANMLSNPAQAPTEAQRSAILAMKNNILSQGLSNQTQGIIALARKDTGSIASQNITRELTERNLQAVKEKTEKILQTNQVTNSNTTKELEQLAQNISKYQNTPPYKASEKNALGKQIEQAMRGFSQGKEAPTATDRSTVGALPAPVSAKVKQASELPATKEGDDLLGSMNVLNATEVAEGAVGKVEDLLAGSEDVNKMLADQNDKNDFEKTKAHWIAFYRDTPVPASDKITSREDWIKEQIKEQEPLLADITQGDYEKREKALNRLQKILPFLLLGNYSLLDITLYLKAKIAAAHTVLDELKHSQTSQTQSAPEKNAQNAPPHSGTTKTVAPEQNTQNTPAHLDYEKNKTHTPSDTVDLLSINNKAQ